VGESALFGELKSRSFLVESITDISRPGKLYRPAPDDLAFIQFSSGSTSEPKGVMLTHGNLIANTQGSTAVDKFNDQDVTLSWMPLTHDMGLIGFYLMQFANRVHIHLMPTELFVRRPLLWLQVASKKRVTITCSPNFGYRHFLKVLGDRRLEGVDLSALRLMYNGAEPISVELCNEFMSTLAYTGLKRQAMYPVYGLAEASLAVTLPELGSDYRWVRVNRHKLAVGSAVEFNPADGRDALELMCVGRVVPNTELRIADELRAPLPNGIVGHILIRGPSVTRGYFGDPEATALAISADGWVDTGHGSQQAGGRRRRQTRFAGRGIGGVRVTSRQHAGLRAGRGRGEPPHQRAYGSRGRSSDSDQAHAQDHQRQGPTASVGTGVYRWRILGGAGGAADAARGLGNRRARVRHGAGNPSAVDLRGSAAGQKN
jgi:hypothetical protein